MPLARSERSLAFSAVTLIAVMCGGAVLFRAFAQAMQEGVEVDLLQASGQMQLLVNGCNGEHAIAGHVELRLRFRADRIARFEGSKRIAQAAMNS